MNIWKCKMNYLGILVSYLYIGIIIVIAKIFDKKGKEASRKFIHIMLGNWWFIAMYFFSNVWFAMFVPVTFIIINYISYKQNLIKVMERDEQDGLGTVYYAVALLILVIVSFGIYKEPLLGLISNLVMAYGDGFAAIFGKIIKSKEYKIGETKKSVAGSITMFIVTILIITLYLIFKYNMQFEKLLIISVILSFIVTIIEAISTKGIDNISVPICVLIIEVIFENCIIKCTL